MVKFKRKLVLLLALVILVLGTSLAIGCSNSESSSDEEGESYTEIFWPDDAVPGQGYYVLEREYHADGTYTDRYVWVTY